MLLFTKNNSDKNIVIDTVKTWSSMIKIEHTLFSLPFVVSAALLALYSSGSAFKPLVFLWIFLCLLGGRSAGMTLNRIIDAKIDAVNPRTRNREIPQGKISIKQAYMFAFISIILLILGASQLPKICQIFLPIPIIQVWLYPYLKRFTWLSHFFLGSILGEATIGGWIAVTGTIQDNYGQLILTPLFLGLAVSCWVAAFDIIYALQDYDFDTSKQLKSIPAWLGKSNGIKVSRVLHFLTILFLYLTGESLGLGLFYKSGVLLTTAALFYEQKLVKENQIDKAFFTINSWISFLMLIFVVMELVFTQSFL